MQRSLKDPSLPAVLNADSPTAIPWDADANDRPAWIDRGRIPCLDGLRALSIALVVGEHLLLAGGFRPSNAFGDLLGHLGSIGVDVFFAISGFLITTLLLREWRREHSVSLKGFYIRRFLRIMPAAIVFLLAVAVFQLLGRVELSGRNWLHVVTYTVNFDPAPAWSTGHLWSLSIEEHFYLLWPLALVVLRPRVAAMLALAWLLCVPIVRLAALLYPQGLGDYELWTPLRIDSISAGCLLAVLVNKKRFRDLARTSEPMAMALMASMAVLIVASFLVGAEIEAYGVTIDPLVRAVCIAILLWLSIAHYRSAWGRLLELKPLVMVGVLSYSLYLWQQPFMSPDSAPGIGAKLLALALTVGCAVASYRFVERPFLTLKNRDKH